MKKAMLVIPALALLLMSVNCARQAEDERTVITKKIQYDVPIVNTDASYDWWIGNIGGSDREELLNNIFGRVLSGDVQAYDYFNEPLSLSRIKSMLTDTVYMSLVRPTPPFAEYDTMVINTIVPADITMIRFLEEWKYDERSLLIDKKVKAISPVMQVMVEGKTMTRPLFWVYFEKTD
jgi:hypothetical protein